MLHGLRIAVVAGAALVCAAGAHAAPHEGWLQDGAPAPPQPNLASQGGFGAMQIATTDDQKLISDWQKPTPGAAISVDSETVRNKPIFVFILFKGCRPDQSGNCNVTADFETFDPGGKSYDVRTNAPIWVGHPPPPGDNLQLSESALGLRVEDKDSLGPYRVVATITDHVAGITLKTQQVLNATAAQ